MDKEAAQDHSECHVLCERTSPYVIDSATGVGAAFLRAADNPDALPRFRISVEPFTLSKPVGKLLVGLLADGSVLLPNPIHPRLTFLQDICSDIGYTI